MLMLHIHEPSLRLSSEGLARNPNTASDDVFALVTACACIGASLHGVAMALRKFYGEGHAQYWLQWRWWIGAFVDGTAGVMIWPAMPIVPVQILVPLVIVVQLVTSYVIGLLFFQEENSPRKTLGLGCAVMGVIGISLSTPHHIAIFPLDEFWAAWGSSRVLCANSIALALLCGSYGFAHRSTFFALAASVLEGIQYICSRTIADSIFSYKLHFMMHTAVIGAFCMKGCCLALIIHFQQMGLESHLSHFAGIFLVGCTLFVCVYGSAFFSDDVDASIMFFASAFLTLAGIWLLNQAIETHDSDSESSRSKAKAVESRDGPVDDEDSAYEGAVQANIP